MRRVRMTIAGESYITLHGVSQCYDCEYAWVEEVYELGLLGHGREIDGAVAILTSMLDRVAQIRRMHVHQGLELAAIAVLLDRLEP